ncbi:DUF4097 family beta strand repeat-containing protein [Microbacterium sp.]|uniref:DUF4097 family beta strand repeat-containing protein n=1 Tax=Microbacterium sp. TaxID=51671 RepID=UPI002810F072|nr:DUF4097 family beta strand repeat-containing protein [Microbacterium sp.]
MNGTTKKSITATTIAVAAVGGLVLLGTGAAAASTGLYSIGPQSGSTEVDGSGITEMDLEVRGAEVTVEFHDGDQAELRVEGGSLRGWSLNRDEGELEVRGPKRGFDWWNPDWLRPDEQRVTLLLPQSAAGLDADLSLDAGSLQVDGEFGELSVDMSAGSLSLDGSARSLDAELNAGRADINLSGVTEASYQVSAGRVVSELTGDAPDVAIEVSAGALTLTLPEGGYDLRRNVSAGSLNSDLSEEPGSRHTITASVSAGTVNLHEG